jgi:hypothetical protein
MLNNLFVENITLYSPLAEVTNVKKQLQVFRSISVAHSLPNFGISGTFATGAGSLGQMLE